MELEWEPARSASDGRLWGEVMPPLAAALRERARELSVEMERLTSAEMPELAEDPEGAELNRTSTEANLLLVADLLERGADPRGVALPPPTVVYAQGGAHQGTPLRGLVRAYRLGHALGWRALCSILEEQVEDVDRRLAAIELVTEWLFIYVDVATGQAEKIYEDERERWLRSAAASRAEVVTAILEGEPTDPRAASARLGYELERTQLAMVAWSDGPDQGLEGIAETEDALRAVCGAGGFDNPLLHPLGLSVVAGWVGRHGDLAEADVPDRLTGEEGSSVRISLGRAGAGLAGFAASHRQALEARRVAILQGSPAGSVIRYSDVALVAMATAEPERARQYVETELGPLAAGDETSLRLMQTLEAYLDEGASHGRAASRLGIHENTVRYRVRQAEDLLGRPIGPGDLDLRVALAVASATSRPPDTDPGAS